MNHDEEELIRSLRENLQVCEFCGRTDCDFVHSDNKVSLAALKGLGSTDSSRIWSLDP